MIISGRILPLFPLNNIKPETLILPTNPKYTYICRSVRSNGICSTKTKKKNGVSLSYSLPPTAQIKRRHLYLSASHHMLPTKNFTTHVKAIYRKLQSYVSKTGSESQKYALTLLWEVCFDYFDIDRAKVRNTELHLAAAKLTSRNSSESWK